MNRKVTLYSLRAIHDVANVSKAFRRWQKIVLKGYIQNTDYVLLQDSMYPIIFDGPFKNCTFELERFGKLFKAGVTDYGITEAVANKIVRDLNLSI